MIYSGIISLVEPQSCCRGSLAVGSEVCRGNLCNAQVHSKSTTFNGLFLVNKTHDHDGAQRREGVRSRKIHCRKGSRMLKHLFASNSTAWASRSGGWCHIAAMADGYKRLSPTRWTDGERLPACVRPGIFSHMTITGAKGGLVRLLPRHLVVSTGWHHDPSLHKCMSMWL